MKDAPEHHSRAASQQPLVRTVGTSYAMPAAGRTAAPRIGEILVADGRMTPQQVEQVVEAQKRGNQRFGELAVKMGFVTEQHVEAVLARQFGLPTATDLSNAKLPSKIVAAMRPLSPFVDVTAPMPPRNRSLHTMWLSRVSLSSTDTIMVLPNISTMPVRQY
jgi:hypothetical protein